MKIFLDWMHRKLHPMDVKYTQVPRKKGEEEAEEKADRLLMVAEEKEALLLHDMLCGILTIGTLGQYQDPFRPSPPFEEAAIGLDDDDDEEEEAPVVVAVEDPLMGVINKEEEEEEEGEITVTVESQERIVEVEDSPLLKEDKERRERGRTTLADLFAADPAVREDANVNKGTKKSSDAGDCKQSHKTKKQKKKEKEKEKEEKKKKKKEEAEEEEKKKKKNGKSSSSSKLLKLMTRMLKKKIHPESITSAEAAAATSIDEHDVIRSSGCCLAY